MTEEDMKKLMEHHRITSEQQTVYYYAGFRYGNLADAVSYAERVMSRANESPAAAEIKPS
jgi:hypothetical protein